MKLAPPATLRVAMYDELDDTRWWQRWAVRSVRRVRKWRCAHWTLFALSTLIVCTCTFVLLYTLLTPDAAELETAARASRFYGLDSSHVDAYRWLDDIRDDAVAQSVIAARAAMPSAQGRALELVARTRALSDAHRLEPVADNVVCSDLFSIDSATNAYYDAMFHDATRFLAHQSPPLAPCSCAAEFGRRKNYLALRFAQPTSRAARDNLQEARDEGAGERDAVDFLSTHAQERDEAAVVLHMLNVVDELYDAYDTLDERELDEHDIQLVVAANETHAYRYNWLLEPLNIVRRRTLRLEYMDRQCHRAVVQLSGSLAQCAQRCIDLMHGKSILERAQAQRAAGVLLNDATLRNVTYAAATAPPTAVLGKEAKDELR